MTSMNAPLSWEAAVETLRNDPAAIDLVCASFYDDPLLAAAERYHASTEWAAVRDWLPPHGSALDLGAGRGIASYALARDGYRTTALEPDDSNIVGAGAIAALSAESGLEIAIVRDWGESLPFADKSFDIVHCRAVLHHAHDLEALCAEVARVLVPGGTMIATREHVVSRQADVPAFQAAHPLHALYGGEYAYTKQRYISALERAGFARVTALNLLESDINLYPTTRADVKKRWSRKLHIPDWTIPDWVLSLRGATLTAPGRHYSFIARTPARA